MGEREVINNHLGLELLEIIRVHALHKILDYRRFDARTGGLESWEKRMDVHMFVSILKYGDIVRSVDPPYNLLRTFE